MSKKLEVYTVAVQIDLWTDVEVKAESFEDALVKARELGVTDIVEFNGGHNDSSVKITGVFK